MRVPEFAAAAVVVAAMLSGAAAVPAAAQFYVRTPEDAVRPFVPQYCPQCLVEDPQRKAQRRQFVGPNHFPDHVPGYEPAGQGSIGDARVRRNDYLREDQRSAPDIARPIVPAFRQ